MTIHNPMPAAQGRAPLPSEGLPTLTNADGVFFLTLSADDRMGIAMTIERLIGILDRMEPDPDREGDYSDWEPEETDENYEDCEPTMGSPNDAGGDFDQTRWAFGSYGDADECEEEDEHGDDINDEPQDDDELEPFLGWSETCGQGVPLGATCGTVAFMDDAEANDGSLGFRGEGQLSARKALRGMKSRQHPNLTYAEIAHQLPDGTIMRTFVTSRDGRVAQC